MPSHTGSAQRMRRIPRLTRRRSMIARWLSVLLRGNLDTQAAPLLQGLAAKRARRARSSRQRKSPLNIRPEPNKGDGTAQQNAGKESADSEDEWPDGYSRGGAPVKGYANTLAAFRKLSIKFYLDTFRQKEFSEGHEIEMLNGELSDRTVTMLRDQIRRECGFYPDKDTVREAITAECLRNRTNPVVEYFNSLKWDGTERLPKLHA